jgi:hypothetical protein
MFNFMYLLTIMGVFPRMHFRIWLHCMVEFNCILRMHEVVFVGSLMMAF